jgi:ComF family protein
MAVLAASRSVRSVCAGALSALLDALLPPQCLTCDAPVDAPGRFCAACFSRLSFITEPCCTGCGVPFAHTGQGGPERLCPACRLHPGPWGRARGALRYDDQSRRVVLALKYRDRTEFAAALAPLMVRAAGPLVAEADVIVPVPLHRRRLLARRYNQAALLARAVAREQGLPAVLDGLRRVRPTLSLADLGSEARAVAVAGAFEVRASRLGCITGQHVLLIDDVLTSGATCRACAEVLLKAGASGVDVLVAARVPDPRLQ